MFQMFQVFEIKDSTGIFLLFPFLVVVVVSLVAFPPLLLHIDVFVILIIFLIIVFIIFGANFIVAFVVIVCLIVVVVLVNIVVVVYLWLCVYVSKRGGKFLLTILSLESHVSNLYISLLVLIEILFFFR